MTILGGSARDRAIQAAVWTVAASLAVLGLGWERAGWALLAALAAHGATLLACRRRERARWIEPIERIAAQIDRLAAKPAKGRISEPAPTTARLVRALNGLADACRIVAAAAASPSARASAVESAARIKAALTKSALIQTNSDSFEIVRDDDSASNAKAALTKSALMRTNSDAFDIVKDVDPPRGCSTVGMVNRLEPLLLRWIESSPAEQEFLGWTLRELREKSFLEIVHRDDVARVQQQLRAAAATGEVHGLILRIRTAHGRPKAIEMNVGVRYGSDSTVNHLRCHITDVTAKVRAERELRLRTTELTQANDRLRQINRELEELKERYRDLYQNAPAMYFSFDEHARILECNETLLRTLGYRREDLIGASCERLLNEERRPLFAERFQDFLKAGTIELTTVWVKAGGEEIDVWLSGTAVRDASGRVVHLRSVAQDVTARRRLEAELQEKNARLARTIEALSRRNKEMDEFTYVVSHDLQEPLRTLTAFSDFLLRDYNDRLDAEGQEFVRYIVEASRRMRALILDLLSLSRAGKVASEFTAVRLKEVADVVRADLGELIRSRGAELRVDGPLPDAWGDRQRLGQLLANLVGNGLKYNDKPVPRVEVGTLDGDHDGWMTLFVRDNGIGIEPQFHAKIFQLFRRLHTREEYEGTGAGLAICDKIVQAHGGRIWVESEPGLGSTFYATLRRAVPGAGSPVSPVPMEPNIVTHAT